MTLTTLLLHNAERTRPDVKRAYSMTKRKDDLTTAGGRFVMEASIEADVSPQFAWKFRSDISTWKDPPAKFVLDGPFAEGSRGSTLMPGQEPLAWWIRDVMPEDSFAIEMPLDRAILRFEWQFMAIAERRTLLTHRIILLGSNASEYREQVEAGFSSTLEPGLRRIAESMVDAAKRSSGYDEGK
jgi:hypothetical protein